MNMTRMQLKEERRQKLFDDCQKQVLSQIIGPFGLSTAMFSDKDGGNVTTTHNFEKGVVATEGDKSRYDEWQNRKKMDWEDQRKPYDDASKTKRANAKKPESPDLISGYTGEKLDKNHHAHYEHITSVKEIEKDTGNNLRMTLDERVALANSQNNTTYIEDFINTKSAAKSIMVDGVPVNIPAKNDRDLMEYYNSLTPEQKKALGLSEKLVKAAYKKSKNHIRKQKTKAFLKKDGVELALTGLQEGGKMAVRQAIGHLLTELVNGLFNEFKILVRHGVEVGKTLLEEIYQRLKRVTISVAEKIPEALSQGLQGGVSAFVSNLLTYLINTFLTTAKRFVSAIREGVLGLYRAFKMIFFPPEHMTPDQALQEGMKILSMVITTTTGMLLQESVKAFLTTMPFLAPFADTLSSVLVGIVTGLLSAFLAYQIDCFFDRLRNSHDERMMDQLMADAKGQEEFANGLVLLAESSLNNVRLYSASIALYDEIGESLYGAEASSSATLGSLRDMVAETQDQVRKTQETIKLIDASNAIVADFLDGN